ncbi:major facilitator superfamily domain-containing protein, partial [Mycena polygramma]
SMSSGVITLYSTTLIRNFGFSAQRSALLNMPSGVVTLLSCLAAAYLGHESENRALVFAGFSVLAALGSALMSFLPSSHRAGLLAGIYLVNIETVTLFLNFSLTTANVAGQTKRVSTNALIAGAFAVGNIIGPQLFKPRDAPQFIPAKVVLLVTQTVGALFAVGLRVYYGRQNRARDAEMESGESKEVANIEWLNLTDHENKTFRYRY